MPEQPSIPVGPVFFLQIIDRGGFVAQLPGGGALELDLIEACVAAVACKSVGVFRTREQVKTAVRAALTEVLMGLKEQTLPLAASLTVR